MFYSDTYLYSITSFIGSSCLDKWATLQLQFVDAHLQSLLMSDQNSWFHRRGGRGWERGRMLTISNELELRKS